MAGGNESFHRTFLKLFASYRECDCDARIQKVYSRLNFSSEAQDYLSGRQNICCRRPREEGRSSMSSGELMSKRSSKWRQPHS
ncbi:hypothetical protein M8J76_011308 [Diaphorina citri]|nr:hypothetical protein M8J75_006215 [Diaphorina citri]KAI5749905.1 hypothetical protein M8J76_011308 [Diaphorina citri]KAI5756082.1 hypothetical protein M8J77_021929 [Diaphorina citri]